MSSSRFSLLAGAALFRSTTTTTTTGRRRHSLTFPPFLPSSKSFPFKPLYPRRFCSSSAAASLDTLPADIAEPAIPPLDKQRKQNQQIHPWPEWVAFVDRLKTRGYFSKPVATDDDHDNGGAAVYKDMTQLKDPCLSFARDRYDVFKSLSMPDIQTVVESGCPNLLRKAVNSAKRLRAYLQLDEGDVCGACNLRGSCDRAYLLLKGNEADVRTVDIVRILLFYALDPLVISGAEKPPGRELVEAASRKLLSELIELSEATPAPLPLKPTIPKASRSHVPSSGLSGENLGLEQIINPSDDNLSRNVKMKRGDWICPKCNFVNFARNVQCLECDEERPKQVDGSDFGLKKGDWICPNPQCSYLNFSRNIQCLKCDTEGPKRVGVNEVEMKKGDWNCPQCSFMNFASNRMCLRCREPRPKRELNPGEWECPSCDFLNYRGNMVCKQCSFERPKEAKTDYDDDRWRSPQKYRLGDKLRQA